MTEFAQKARNRAQYHELQAKNILGQTLEYSKNETAFQP